MSRAAYQQQTFKWADGSHRATSYYTIGSFRQPGLAISLASVMWLRSLARVNVAGVGASKTHAFVLLIHGDLELTQ